uniref:carnitine O-palmitoyltransferase n=1 Tax=Anopheles minimus TaxID=112268 RepID=A0A182WA64_9DIPT
MAEAHSAVAFSFSITHEGWDINYDREVLDLVWQSGVRSWKKRLARFRTRLWGLFVKVLATWNKPGLYSFQGSLPRLPLPSVQDTMTRYLRSVRPLLDDSNYNRMERLAKEFQLGISTKLQRYLFLKSWWSTNYVSDWWEEYVYLRGRGALMVNSNFYGIDAIFMHPTKVQSARAASVVNLLLQFRRTVERQELEPILVQGLVPLCSWQYERIFNTVRAPGVETDKIIHYQDSNHIVVLYRGCYYKVIIYHNGRILRPCELQIQIEYILQQGAEKPQPGEEMLASLTAGDRTKWAQIRQTVFAKGVNRTSLHTVESAAFVLSLDEKPFEFDLAHPEKLDQFGRYLLHGNGHDRWFDKSFTVCVGSNGRIGFNAEHTWADAPVMAHVWENIVAEEATNKRYDENGNTTGIPEFEPPTPKRLTWDLNDKVALGAIDEAYIASQRLLEDVDLRILVHDAYGKGLMKTCRLSPDAFIQMALQLAYYRDAGKFSLTYEASMTRLFREGRTETVRPCTIESAAWVKAMLDKDVTVLERVRLLNEACERHQLGYQDAMCGKGIDRHLFCLYVVSKYLEIDSPFLQEVLSEPWRLSTSQTPHGQTSKMDLKKHPNCISAGGGFGPVADDGYGVSYIVAGEDLIFFHISSKKSCGTTSSERFAQEICRALADMKHLFEEYRSLQKKTTSSGTKSDKSEAK